MKRSCSREAAVSHFSPQSEQAARLPMANATPHGFLKKARATTLLSARSSLLVLAFSLLFHLSLHADDSPLLDIYFEESHAGTFYHLAEILPRVTGIRRIPEGKLFFPEEYPSVIAEEARVLWSQAGS